MPNKSRLWNTGEYSPPSSRRDYTFVGLILCDVSRVRVEAAQPRFAPARQCKGVFVDGVGLPSASLRAGSSTPQRLHFVKSLLRSG